MGRVLVIDDDCGLVQVIRLILEDLGLESVVAATGGGGLALLAEKGPFDLVVTDLRLPDTDGLSLAREVSRVAPGLPVLLLSGDARLLGSADARALGIAACLAKPIELEELERAIVEQLRSRREAGCAPRDVFCLAPPL